MHDNLGYGARGQIAGPSPSPLVAWRGEEVLNWIMIPASGQQQYEYMVAILGGQFIDNSLIVEEEEGGLKSSRGGAWDAEKSGGGGLGVVKWTCGHVDICPAKYLLARRRLL